MKCTNSKTFPYRRRKSTLSQRRKRLDFGDSITSRKLGGTTLGKSGKPERAVVTSGVNGSSAFRSSFWTLIIMTSVVAGGFFLHNNTSEFIQSTVQTTLDGSVPLSEVFFPSVVVCNINQIRKSFFAELGFYENDTLVRIMYEDFIKGTMDSDWEASEVTNDPKRDAFYDVSCCHHLLQGVLFEIVKIRLLLHYLDIFDHMFEKHILALLTCRK